MATNPATLATTPIGRLCFTDSLFTAKEWCKDILAKGISSDPFERRLV